MLPAAFYVLGEETTSRRSLPQQFRNRGLVGVSRKQNTRENADLAGASSRKAVGGHFPWGVKRRESGGEVGVPGTAMADRLGLARMGRSKEPAVVSIRKLTVMGGTGTP
jgi:hypothetical protein